MARRRKDKEKIADPFERARLKKLRAAQRREERKKRRAGGGDEGSSRRSRETPPDYSKPMVKDDYLWIRRSQAKSFAMKIMNDHRDRPYWLSIPRPRGDTPADRAAPVSQYFPCTMFSTQSRVYYGFLFIEHRDLFFKEQSNARKEMIETISKLNPNVV